jgi:hypothetical protein
MAGAQRPAHVGAHHMPPSTQASPLSECEKATIQTGRKFGISTNSLLNFGKRRFTSVDTSERRGRAKIPHLPFRALSLQNRSLAPLSAPRRLPGLVRPSPSPFGARNQASMDTSAAATQDAAPASLLTTLLSNQYAPAAGLGLPPIRTAPHCVSDTKFALETSPLAPIPGLSPTVARGPTTPLSWQGLTTDPATPLSWLEIQAHITASRAQQPTPAPRPPRAVTAPDDRPRRRVYSFQPME